MAKFTDDQKKFIIKIFGTTSSPAIVRRQFLKKYKIKGRVAKQFRLHYFTRTNQCFQKNGTFFRKKKSKKPTKKTPEKVEDVRTFLGEKSRSSIRKSAPQLDISPTTYWRIVKKTFVCDFNSILPYSH